MKKENIISIEDRIPKLKQLRKKKANRRLILLLSLFFILIACVLYFLSPLSQIKKVHVVGNEYISSDQIINYSGLTNDKSIWKIDKKQVSKKIKKNQQEIKKVSISLKFPNSVEITVEEYDRIAYQLKTNHFYPIMENGEILKALDEGEIPVYAPVLFDFTEGDPLNLLLDELVEIPEEIRNSISEVHNEPYDADPYHITMYMNDGFEVSATSRTLSAKMKHYPSIVSQLDPKIKGVIDLEVGSFFKAYNSPETVKEDGAKNEGN